MTTTKTASTKPARRATIIGGSIAGLSCGLALQNSGWDVRIFEATEGALAQRGAGIITHQSLFDALLQFGIEVKQDIGVPIQIRKTFNKNGDVAETLKLPQIATSWGRMYQLLRNKFPDDHYFQNKTLKYCQQHEHSVDAVFTDESCHSADLLIAADGIRSTIRNQLEPDAKPQYAGYVAWRGLIEERDMSTEEQREILPYFTFCLPEGEQVLTYPITGKQNDNSIGKRRCNVVWYRPASAATLNELLTDIDGNNNGQSIAPDKVRPEIVQKMRNDAVSMLSPQHCGLIQRLDQPFIQPIYDLTTTSMVHGRVVIVGDAAFTARPHLAAGITKATQDALELARILEGTADILDAVTRFKEKRTIAGHKFVNQARELGAYLQAQLINDDERHFAQMHRTTTAVMRETAVLSD